MTDLDHVSRNRLRLWLRGERAFGLSRVAVSLVDASESQQQQAEDVRTPQPTPVRPQPTMAVPRAAPVTPAVSRPEAVEVPHMARRAPSSPPKLDEPTLIPALQPASFDAPVLPREQKALSLKQLDDHEVKGCVRCRLHETRTKTVFGEGDPDAPIFFIGEGPGENEDLQGRPFVGKAGQLLDKMIAGMGLKREQVFIANIVKCRPPGNRVPAPDEVATCTPYLERQLEIVRPKVIVTLGRPAASYMLNSKLPMGRLRGEWQSWRGIKLMPTFHPSYVLRSYTEEVRAAVWSDLKKVLIELGLPVPKRGGAAG